MPQTDESRFSISVELQSGTRVDKTIEIARQVDKILKTDFPEIELIATSAGADEQGGLLRFFFRLRDQELLIINRCV